MDHPYSTASAQLDECGLPEDTDDGVRVPVAAGRGISARRRWLAGTAAEGDTYTRNPEGGNAGQGGHRTRRDPDAAARGGLHGVPDIVEQSADAAHDRGDQGGRCGDRRARESVHGGPQTGEFGPGSPAVRTADLVGPELVGMAGGELFEQLVDAGAAGQLPAGNAQW
jgi:hypothetical protein